MATDAELKHIIQDPRAIKAIAIKYNLKKLAFWRVEQQVVRYYDNHYIPQGACFPQMLLLFVCICEWALGYVVLFVDALWEG